MASQTPASGTETKPEIDKSKVRAASRAMLNALVSEATGDENLAALTGEIAKKFPGVPPESVISEMKVFAWKLTKPA